MNHVIKWNPIDSIIFYCENKVKMLKAVIRAAIEDSSSAEPNVEAIIATETEYLQLENERLKKREIPVYLIEDENTVICPKCNEQLLNPGKIKYCPNCGHRVIRHIERMREN